MKLILTTIYCAHYFLDPRFQEITGLSGTVFKEFKGHLFTSSTSIQDTFNLFKKTPAHSRTTTYLVQNNKTETKSV